MPLRPVSELGLVEVTDLESRANRNTVTRRSQSREHESSTRPGREDASRKRTSTSASKSRAAERSGSESKPARQAAKSGSSSVNKHARSSGSGSRRPAPRGNATSTNGETLRAAEPGSGSEARGTQRALRDGSSHAQTKRSAVVDTGLSLLGGAIGVAGGILLCRSVLQR
jgi:hypothetical protein